MRKRIIWAAFCAVMLFASCHNDNVVLQRVVNFKVNPSEVTGGFAYETDKEELQSLGAGYKLRIHLLVYDAMGTLKAENVDYVSGYQSDMDASTVLPEGNYTAVAITDVVKTDATGNVTTIHWNISNTNHLAGLTIADAGLLNGKYKLLGIATYSFSVGNGSLEHVIKVQPAGTLFRVEATNIHYYSTAVQYELGINKGLESLVFNGDGSYAIAADDGGESFVRSLGYFKPQEHATDDECQYFEFALPLGRTNFQWFGKTDDGESLYVGDRMTATLQQRDEYLVRFELGSEIIAQISLVGGGKTSDQ